MTDIFGQRHGRKNFFFQHVLDDIETVDRIKYANFQLSYFSNDSRDISWENGERLRLHPDFNHHPFGYCVIFSGKKVTVPKSEGARTPMPNSDLYGKIIYRQGNFKVAYAYKYLQILDGLFDGLFDRQKKNNRYLLLLLHHLAMDRANNRSFLISSQLNRSEVPTFFPRVGYSKIKVPTFPPPQGQKFVAKSP